MQEKHHKPHSSSREQVSALRFEGMSPAKFNALSIERSRLKSGENHLSKPQFIDIIIGQINGFQ